MIIKNINPVYFWDLDFEKLNPLDHKRIIIERVVSLGNLNELLQIEKFYGIPELVKVVKKINFLDAKTLNFIALVWGVPKTQFKCYHRKLLTTKHWH